MVERRIRDRPRPLFAWLEVRRAAQVRRLRLRRRAALIAAGIACLGLTVALPPVPRLVWNASASAPIGLYAVSPGAALQRGDMVIAWPPAQARQLAARRHYLPSNVPLVKRVVGVTGDRICAVDHVVTLNDRPVTIRRATDAEGRDLPAWQGCIRLGPAMVFLLMTETPNSFDGRYFGPTLAQDVIGKATPLWLR